MAERSSEERRWLMREPHEIRKRFYEVKVEIESTQQNFHEDELLPALRGAERCIQYWRTAMQNFRRQDIGEETSRAQVLSEALRQDLEQMRQDKRHINALFQSFRERRVELELRLFLCARSVIVKCEGLQACTAETPQDLPPHRMLAEMNQLEKRITELVLEDKTLLPQQEELQGSEDMLDQTKDVEQLLEEMEKEADSAQQLRLRIEERASRFCTFLADVENYLR